jgi:hypothetical protein
MPPIKGHNLVLTIHSILAIVTGVAPSRLRFFTPLCASPPFAGDRGKVIGSGYLLGELGLFFYSP